MAASVLTSYAMPLQMIFLEAIDVDVVRANPRTQGLHYSVQRHHTLSFSGFLQVFKHYRICPDLLSRAQVLTLFKSLDKQHPSKMEMHDFMAALAKAAMLVFSSEEWDRQYPADDQKMRLLLLWMDKNSRLFKGNGRKLCKSVAGTADQDNTPALRSINRWLCLPHIEPLDAALQTAFGYYCADDSDAITSMSFLRFLRDAGLADDENLRLADIDVIFHQIRGKHGTPPLPQTLCFEEFYAALGLVSSRLYTTTGSSNRCFLRLMNDYILPAMAHMHHTHLPLHNHHDSWREQWQQLCTLKQVLASPATNKIFDEHSTDDLSAHDIHPAVVSDRTDKEDEIQSAEATSIMPGYSPPTLPEPFLTSASVTQSPIVMKAPSASNIRQPTESPTPDGLSAHSSSQDQNVEMQVLDELQRLSQHLRQKMQHSCHQIPTTDVHPLPPSALRLKAALDRLSQELSVVPMSSACPRRHPTDFESKASTASASLPRRAKQRQPHTLHG